MPDRSPSALLRRAMRSTLGAALIALVVSAPAQAQTWHDFRAARQVQGVETLKIQVLFGAGRLSVTPNRTPFLYDAKLHYDASKLEAQQRWRRDGTDGHLRLAVSSIPNEEDDARARLRVDDWDLEFDLEDLPRSLDESAELGIGLHPDIPTNLRLGVGTGRTRLDMGGLTLESLEFVAGASDVRLSFDQPNQTRMDRLSIKSGAAEFVGEDLGNARFDHLEFIGFVGDVVLDFSGEWTASAQADIKMALGELVLRVPSDIGVRIRRNGLASVDAEDFEKVGDAYLSPNWPSAPIRLEIQLTAGLGKISIERT